MRESSALSRASPAMNIHEYQAQELLQKFGGSDTARQSGLLPEEAEQIAREIAPGEIVVKAQIHAGGRGKGTFANGFNGGVHVCKTPEEAREIARQMLGHTLVTHQTGPRRPRRQQSAGGRGGADCA